MKLYVDDEREAPEGWDQARSCWEAIRMLWFFDTGITDISLDHDNGGETFQSVAMFIALMKKASPHWTPNIVIHSQNPVGAGHIKGILSQVGLKLVVAPFKDVV